MANWSEFEFKGLRGADTEKNRQIIADDKAEKAASKFLFFLVVSSIGYAVMTSFVVGLITGSSLAIGFVILIGIAAAILDFIITTKVSFKVSSIITAIGCILLIARIVLLCVFDK